MFNPIGDSIQKFNPFAGLTRGQFCTWALINATAIAAIVHTRRSTVIGTSIGAMIGSFGAAWNRGTAKKNDGSCSTIFFGAVVGAGFGFLVERTTYPSYLADLASGEEIITRAGGVNI